MKPILEDIDYVVAAQLLQIETAVIKAFCKVEAPRGGFCKDDRPVILYEPFRFSKLTAGKYDGQSLQIDRNIYPLSLPGKWNRAAAKYGPESIQYYKLEAAQKFDHDAALKACSWGKFQLLGEYYKLYGFESVTDFVNAMYVSEKKHLLAFVKKIQSEKKGDLLRSKNWQAIAAWYNGSGYAENHYDVNLEKAYHEYSV